MRAVVLQRQTSGPVAEQVRCVEDWPDPGPPGPGELQLRTICSALNHMDLWVGRGIPGVELRYPHVSGSDGCGIVEVVGNGVDDAWLGQRVIHNSALVQPLPSSPDSRTGVSLAPSIHLLGEHVHGATGNATTFRSSTPSAWESSIPSMPQLLGSLASPRTR